jgi:esterase/lipase
MWICKSVIGSIIQNEDTGKIDWNKIKNFYYYAPGGTSIKNLIHWIQSLAQPSMRMFNYGKQKNLEIYGSELAPEYNIKALQNMTIELFITTSDSDPYCNDEDFNFMFQTFMSSKKTLKKLNNYNHLDYLWGSEAHNDFYYDIVEFLDADH